MKQGIQLLLLLIVFIGISNCRKKPENIVYDKAYIKEIKEIRKKMVFFLSSNSVPGATVAVSINGKIIYSESMGLASKELNVPATLNTKFRIGQLSELYTSAIYLKMVEEGILHPDSSLQFYLPDFPRKKFRVNLAHLVNHTSGIMVKNSKEEDRKALSTSLQRGLENFKNHPLEYEPGSFQLRSMYNYNLLGAVMEKAVNQPFHTILKDFLCDTLQLNNTEIDNPLKTIKGRSDCFDRNLISQPVNAASLDLRYCAPSKGILSNAEDLVKFANALLFSDYLKEVTKEKMFKPIILLDSTRANLKNGWMLMSSQNGGSIYGNESAVVGGCGTILIYPEHGLVIACTNNLGADSAPVFEIAEQFIPQAMPSE